MKESSDRPAKAEGRKPAARAHNYLLLSGSLLLSAVVGELAARPLVPAPLPWLWPQVVYEPSGSLGFRLRPSQESYSADKPVRTNSLGLRGPETSLRKPAGVRRVLVLGDSIAFGYGVRFEDTFGARLQEMLNRPDAPPRYEVINAGVPSYNTVQEVAYFREHGARLEPDVVVLALYWNDVSDKSGVGVDARGRLVEMPPAPRGRLAEWLESSVGFGLRNLVKRSRLLYFIADRCRSVLPSGSSRLPQHSRMQRAVLTNRPDPDVDRGWRAVEAALRELAGLCRERSMRLWVALLPMPQAFRPQYPAPQYPDAAKRLCEAHAIDYVDCTRPFRSRYTDHASLFIPYDGDHPNEDGHLLIARTLYSAIHGSSSR